MNQQSVIHVEHWPTETVLKWLVILASLVSWILLCISIIGLLYVLFFGVFFFVVHLFFITNIRGSAVRLGPDQLPELYARTSELAAKAGIRNMPEIYLMQAGGALNAMAAKFLRSKMIILYSDLIDACGDNTSARDMIIGHELGHIRASHLSWYWFMCLGMMIPFLGSAYSRAREYTCDRYGATLCGDRQGAMLGLAILAAGGNAGRKIKFETFAQQVKLLDTGLMTIGKWLATHPQLSERIAAIEPQMAGNVLKSSRGPLRALAIIFVVPVITGLFIGGIIYVGHHFGLFSPKPKNESTQPTEGAEAYQLPLEVYQIFYLLSRYQEKHESLPDNQKKLEQEWKIQYPQFLFPVDEFGTPFRYHLIEKRRAMLVSAGPDLKFDTQDDTQWEYPEDL